MQSELYEKQADWQDKFKRKYMQSEYSVRQSMMEKYKKKLKEEEIFEQEEQGAEAG